MTLRLAASILTLGLAGCAHSSLEGSDLDQVQRPAFVSRVADEAGPRVTVYRSDSAQASKLTGTSPADADHRSSRPASSRRCRSFEAAERLRSHVYAAIDTEKPWSQAVPPSQVASALETFLVQEVPGTAPDYARLKPLGADSVVEFVIEEYGIRTEKGVPQTWVSGSGRMFRLSRRRRAVAERLLGHLDRGRAAAARPVDARRATRARSRTRWSRCSTRSRSGWPGS